MRSLGEVGVVAIPGDLGVPRTAIVARLIRVAISSPPSGAPWLPAPMIRSCWSGRGQGRRSRVGGRRVRIGGPSVRGRPAGRPHPSPRTRRSSRSRPACRCGSRVGSLPRLQHLLHAVGVDAAESARELEAAQRSAVGRTAPGLCPQSAGGLGHGDGRIVGAWSVHRTHTIGRFGRSQPSRCTPFSRFGATWGRPWALRGQEGANRGTGAYLAASRVCRVNGSRCAQRSLNGPVRLGVYLRCFCADVGLEVVGVPVGERLDPPAGGGPDDCSEQADDDQRGHVLGGDCP